MNTTTIMTTMNSLKKSLRRRYVLAARRRAFHAARLARVWNPDCPEAFFADVRFLSAARKLARSLRLRGIPLPAEALTADEVRLLRAVLG